MIIFIYLSNYFINLAVTSSLAKSLSSSEMRTKSRLFSCNRLAMTVGLYAFLLERGLQCKVRRDSFLIFFRVSSSAHSSSRLQWRYSNLDRISGYLLESRVNITSGLSELSGPRLAQAGLAC